jgi:hypothetical protein
VNAFTGALAFLPEGDTVKFMEATLVVPPVPAEPTLNGLNVWIGLETESSTFVIQPQLKYDQIHGWYAQDGVYPFGVGTNQTEDHAVHVEPGQRVTMMVGEVSPGVYEAWFPGLTQGLIVGVPGQMVKPAVMLETVDVTQRQQASSVKLTDVHIVAQHPGVDPYVVWSPDWVSFSAIEGVHVEASASVIGISNGDV